LGSEQALSRISRRLSFLAAQSAVSILHCVADVICSMEQTCDAMQAGFAVPDEDENPRGRTMKNEGGCAEAGFDPFPYTPH
jgi:hypothetical protein